MTKTKGDEWKRRRLKEERTYQLSVGRERIACDIRITGQGMLLSKAIKTIRIDHPREM